MITVQPATSAGATLVVMIMKGAFQGAMAATTPTGSRPTPPCRRSCGCLEMALLLSCTRSSRIAIATGLFELGENIADGRRAEMLIGELFGADRFQKCAVADHGLDGPLGRFRDALDDLGSG